MKGIIPFVAIGILAISALGVTGLPVAYDHFMGNQTMPDDALYGLEIAGEKIRCALSPDKPACFLELANERDMEYVYIQGKLPDVADIQKYQDMAEELRMQAEEYRGLI